MREQWECLNCHFVFVVFAKNAVDLFENGCNRCRSEQFILLDEVSK